MMDKIKAFVRFSRPHTVVGTTLSISGLWVIANSLQAGAAWDLSMLTFTLVSCLGANIYIVGLNQLTDMAIDRVNKPYLPLASGAFTITQGWILIGISLLLALALAHWLGPYLMWTVGLSLFLGTIYSMPPFRLKRFPFWAAFCIIAVRGMIVNILLFLHFQHTMGAPPHLPLVIWLLVGLMFTYGLVIALFKDMPDTEGDRLYAIETFSLQWGVEQVFFRGGLLLALALLSVVVLAVFVDLQVNVAFFILAHLVFLGLLYRASGRVNLGDKGDMTRFYQFVWRLFFMEYVVFALSAALPH